MPRHLLRGVAGGASAANIKTFLRRSLSPAHSPGSEASESRSSVLVPLAHELVEELVAGVEQPTVAKEHDPHRPECGPGGDEEHNHNLILHGTQGTRPGENLAGHHAGQAHDADHHHRV